MKIFNINTKTDNSPCDYCGKQAIKVIDTWGDYGSDDPLLINGSYCKKHFKSIAKFAIKRAERLTKTAEAIAKEIL